jgi:hypothetical protein
LVSPTLDGEFPKDDLSVKRIEDIAPHLWVVGRPYLPRPLNLQRILKREIGVATTDASLHLVWTYQTLYVKALPRYLVSMAFFEQRLSLPHPCGPALGLLFTYMALVPSELDFALAHDLHLLPTNYKWEEWKKLTRRILDEYPDKTIYNHLPVRYTYGELRLSRLNKLCRFRCMFDVYSPLIGSVRYTDFISDNLRIITAVTAYIIVVSTAMQVGLATDSLASNDSFQRACYGFTVFAIISPVVALGAIVGLPAFVLACFFISSWSRMIRFHRERLECLDNTPPSKAPSPRAGDVPEGQAV